MQHEHTLNKFGNFPEGNLYKCKCNLANYINKANREITKQQ